MTIKEIVRLGISPDKCFKCIVEDKQGFLQRKRLKSHLYLIYLSRFPYIYNILQLVFTLCQIIKYAIKILFKATLKAQYFNSLTSSLQSHSLGVTLYSNLNLCMQSLSWLELLVKLLLSRNQEEEKGEIEGREERKRRRRRRSSSMTRPTCSIV